MRVTGIGQCSWDYIGIVDSFPSPDTKVEMNDWQEQGGGPVATALVALARLGVSCRFCGIVGDDTRGGLIRESLHEEGVDTEGLLIRRGTSSQLAFIAVEKHGGKRTIFWKRPSGKPLRKEELGCNFLEGTDFLHLDGLMDDVLLYAAREARKRSIPVMVDAGRMRPGMLELARNCDYVVASERFARDIKPDWEADTEAFGLQLNRLGLNNVTITLGERGSVTFLDTGIKRIPAFKVQAIDTTGAGDVFHGGFIFGLLKGWSIEDTVCFASATAALKCIKVGGRAGIPTLDETMAFLTERGVAIRP
jgi:sulfofructose kinase